MLPMWQPGWAGWASGAPVPSALPGSMWTCGWPGSSAAAPRPPARAGGCRRCRVSTDCAAHDLASGVPTAGVARPVVDADYTATVGLARDEARALVAAADADRGRQALRNAAAVRLLLHNALRVDEACAVDVADLGTDAGHRVLRVTRKGARKAKVPMTPATAAALDAYLAARPARAGLGSAAAPAGPLLATATGGRLRQGPPGGLGGGPAPAARVGAGAGAAPQSPRPPAGTVALVPR